MNGMRLFQELMCSCSSDVVESNLLIWDAIEDQILPDEVKPVDKEMFFQFLKENPSKVLLVLDGFDEADPHKSGNLLETYSKEAASWLLHCFSRLAKKRGVK